MGELLFRILGISLFTASQDCALTQTKTFGDTKILFHAYGDPDGWFATPFVSGCLRALGLNPEDCVSFHRPTRIQSLIVPELSFGEMSFAFPVFRDLCHRIGNKLLENRCAPSYGHEPIYLSKLHLPIGVGKINNEGELIGALQKRMNIKVVSPERLTFEEQIELFHCGLPLIGTVSSAFHTSIFSSRKPKMIALTPKSNVASNFRLIDLINSNKSTYLNGSEHFKTIPADRNFLEVFDAIDVEVLADDYATIVLQEKPGSLRRRDINMHRNPNNLDNLQGVNYRSVLASLRRFKTPKTYLEIGTLNGATLADVDCNSIAIDPKFQISRDVIGKKETCLFFQMKSDDFFKRYDPTVLLNGQIDFVYLDGMHLCEFLLRDFLNAEQFCRPDALITIHDCIPVEGPMTSRIQNAVPAEDPERAGWWTGDVWRTVVTLKRMRPDLKIVALDADPTGLVVVTGLKTVKKASYDEYEAMLTYMMNLDLSIEDIHKALDVQSTTAIKDDASIKAFLYS